jgi:hypothetical protein
MSTKAARPPRATCPAGRGREPGAQRPPRATWAQAVALQRDPRSRPRHRAATSSCRRAPRSPPHTIDSSGGRHGRLLLPRGHGQGHHLRPQRAMRWAPCSRSCLARAVSACSDSASSSASPVLTALPCHELPWGGHRWSTRGDEVGGKGRERIESG